MGERKNKVCMTSAVFFKQIFEKLNKTAEFYHLHDYKVTMEATHHGPLIEKPCIFIEIGSTEAEWTDRIAGFVVAKTIAETIAEYKRESLQRDSYRNRGNPLLPWIQQDTGKVKRCHFPCDFPVFFSDNRGNGNGSYGQDRRRG